MKKIFFIFDRNITTLPPLMTVIDSLIDTYELTVVIRDHEEVIENLYTGKKIEFISFNKPLRFKNKFFRAYNRIKRIHFFRHQIPLLIKEREFDLVWIISAEAAIQLGRPINGIKYLFSIYELYDIVPDLLKKIKPFAQNAIRVIVPEYNRANMLRFWLDLTETPTVIPNKPASLPQPSSEIPEQIKSVADKKIILYQGYINRGRNLDALCKAVSSMPDYVIVLMGIGNDDYLGELKSKYPAIIHIGFLPPPSHLNITSHAYIGVVTYEFTDLNAVYCAPNKIWEYSGYGVPILANNIPGLVYTVGKDGAGCCIDMDNPKIIKDTIDYIDAHYTEYGLACIKMYNSFDVKKSINTIVENCI
jgi:glycosyltransferase involved in cell wall biosynthesis